MSAKPTELDDMNRLRVEAEREVARLKGLLRRKELNMTEAEIRADEREVCALACEATDVEIDSFGREDGNATLRLAAAAIRARSLGVLGKEETP